MHVGVIIIRVPEGLDYSSVLGDKEEPPIQSGSRPSSVSDTPPGTPTVERHVDVNELPEGENTSDVKEPKKSKKSKKKAAVVL